MSAARRTPQKASPAAPDQPDPGLKLEIWGLLLLVAAVLLLLSLLTYQPSDPALSEAEATAQNWIGRGGAAVADAFLQGFGYSAYLVALALGSMGVLLGLRRPVRLKVKLISGFVLFALTSSILFGLLLPATGMAHAPGGLVGALLTRGLEPVFGTIGLGILASVLLVLSIVMATNLPPLRSAAFLSRQTGRGLTLLGRQGLSGAQTGLKSLRKTGGWLWERRQKRRETLAARREVEAETPDVQEETTPAAPPRIVGQSAPPTTSQPDSEEAEAAAARAGLLDRDEREVVITVRRQPQDGPAENSTAPAETEAVSVEEPTADAADDEPVAKSTPRKRRKKASEEGEPEIVDQRPKRASDQELSTSELTAEEVPKEYQLPSLSLLHYEADNDHELDKEQLFSNARLLEQTLLDYKIEGKVTEIHPGPVVTMYEFAPARGTKLSRITNLEDDLAMALAALKVRIVAPIPGKSVVGIEVPSANRETVYLKEIIGHKRFTGSKGKLTIALGKDIFGYPMVADLQKMPHLLIAGATGAGKSVGVNAMILSILFRCTPEDVRFILIDPKRLEFNFYEGIPHLLLPVVTDPKQASLALGWVVHEMDTRYQTLSEWGVKNIDSFNRLVRKLDEARAKRGGDIEQVIEEFSRSEGGDLRALAGKLKKSPPPKRLPFIIVVIDELADLMMVAGKEVEVSIARLAQLARASGIHLLVATQRPSTDVLTGLIKNNFPARISYRVSQKVDSRVIIDQNGAEALLGRGDMLFLPGTGELQRIHAAFVSENETIQVVDFVKRQLKPTYKTDILQRIEAQAEQAQVEAGEYDSEYDKAVMIICESGKASISMLQRKLRIGYNRAARIIEKMEEDGLVGPSDGVRGRPVYGRPAPKD